ncbi:hypothetical protein ABIC86_002380 [Paenibacillus sp. DS2363]|uniref:hypothetical protein n=1 Tax=unclassified Paenibacillus TaxID=185978 RepID=UPI0030F75B1A
MKSTDVKHSIAGFYFQLLIACYELVNVYEYEDAYVGVECDADVRVNYGNDQFIEAKFYSDDSFTRNQEAITHTIYNFYHTYKRTKTSGTFQIKTNVPFATSDFDFFNNWNTKKFDIPNEYINYVKDCLVYEYADKKEGKEAYEVFKMSYKKSNPQLKRPQFKRALINHLHLYPDEYKNFLSEDVLISDEEILEFVKLVTFDTPRKKVDKFSSILALKEKTEYHLSVHFPGLSNFEYENIRFLIMNAFLDTTVDTTSFILKTSSINQIVANHTESIQELFNKDVLVSSIKDIEIELIKYELLLKRKGHSDSLDRILKVVGTCTEQWVHGMKEYGVTQMNSRYLMGSSPSYALNILELFKAMGEIYALSEKELGDIDLFDLEGINNVSFSEYKGFSLKTTHHASDKQDEQMLITAFIEHTLKDQHLMKAIGDETIIFDADCKICDPERLNIEDIVMDISKPYGTILNQEFYRSFQYKCIRCVRLLTHDADCPFTKSFKEGRI